MTAQTSDLTAPTTSPMTTATVCVRGMFGYQTIHASDLTIEIVKYAQYERAARVTFVRKGCRKRDGFMVTSHPSLVVLAGHVDVALKPQLEAAEGGEVTRFVACDERWDVEFAEALVASGHEPVRDFRGHDAASRF